MAEPSLQPSPGYLSVIFSSMGRNLETVVKFMSLSKTLDLKGNVETSIKMSGLDKGGKVFNS